MRTVRTFLYASIAALVLTSPAQADHCPDLVAEIAAIADMRDSDPTGGVARGERSLAALRARHACPIEEARLLGAIGSNLNILGRNEEAARLFAEAMELGEGRLNAADRSLLLRGSGLVQYDLGEFDAAARLYVASLEASEEAGDTVEAAKTAANLGILYITLGQADQAQRFHERALQGFTEAGFMPGVAGTLINLGSVAARRARDAELEGKHDEERGFNEQLREYNQRALELFTELGNRRGVAYAASNVGLAWDRLGDPARGLAYHERSLAVRRELGDAHGVINSLVSMAAALTALERHDEADTLLREAHGLLPTGNPSLRLTVLEPWVSVAEARGDIADALRLQRQVTRLRAGIVLEDHRTRVNEIETRYQAEQLRRQIADLELEQVTASERLRRQQLTTWSAVTIAVLLLALIGALFARYRLKVRSQLALEQAARTDDLTGLANRRDMRERVEYEIQRTRRSTRPFSVGIIDLDEFKAINDTYGHGVGDKVLVKVAERLRGLLRRQDTLARWGGDELMVLLPETDEAGALALGRKLVTEFDLKPVVADGASYRVTLTVGIAQYWPGMEIDQCLQCADEALYQGKNAGRNQVRAKRP